MHPPDAATAAFIHALLDAATAPHTAPSSVLAGTISASMLDAAITHHTHFPTSAKLMLLYAVMGMKGASARSLGGLLKELCSVYACEDASWVGVVAKCVEAWVVHGHSVQLFDLFGSDGVCQIDKMLDDVSGRGCGAKFIRDDEIFVANEVLAKLQLDSGPVVDDVPPLAHDDAFWAREQRRRDVLQSYVTQVSSVPVSRRNSTVGDVDDIVMEADAGKSSYTSTSFLRPTPRKEFVPMLPARPNHALSFAGTGLMDARDILTPRSIRQDSSTSALAAPAAPVILESQEVATVAAVASKNLFHQRLPVPAQRKIIASGLTASLSIVSPAFPAATSEQPASPMQQTPTASKPKYKSIAEFKAAKRAEDMQNNRLSSQAGPPMLPPLAISGGVNTVVPLLSPPIKKKGPMILDVNVAVTLAQKSDTLKRQMKEDKEREKVEVKRRKEEAVHDRLERGRPTKRHDSDDDTADAGQSQSGRSKSRAGSAGAITKQGAANATRAADVDEEDRQMQRPRIAQPKPRVINAATIGEKQTIPAAPPVTADEVSDDGVPFVPKPEQQEKLTTVLAHDNLLHVPILRRFVTAAILQNTNAVRRLWSRVEVLSDDASLAGHILVKKVERDTNGLVEIIKLLKVLMHEEIAPDGTRARIYFEVDERGFSWRKLRTRNW